MSSTPDAPRSNTPWEEDPHFNYQPQPGPADPYAASDPYAAPYSAAPGPIPPYQRGPASSDEQSMAMLAHLSTIGALILSAGWLSFVGPLIVWAIYKDRSQYVREAAAGAFNFNIAMWLVTIAGWLAIFTFIGAIVGIPMVIVAFLLQLIYHVLGAVRANRGESFQYPFQIRLLS
ncbi:DUF4870 domain-containing protein [Gephyromycinifex aptenodytis]|uniref:DUF4870 domain-containing protein n=1 Tax=Gephyromycinifex aptenodytis TaxID=2716227 RepID=UPI001D016573|nr:DUF4870 domain-containing protein [Gephyromycinifex aptenodytis]